MLNPADTTPQARPTRGFTRNIDAEGAVDENREQANQRGGDPPHEAPRQPEPIRRHRRPLELEQLPGTEEVNIRHALGGIEEGMRENAAPTTRPGPTLAGPHDAQSQQMHYSKVAELRASKTKDPTEAKRRLMQNLHALQKTIHSGVSVGISAQPVNGDLFHWQAVIAGPESTPWEGGLFKLDLVFTDEYPMEPPKVRFLTKDIFHPNVYVDGNICLDILRGFWSPTLDLESLLVSIISLLSDPNPSSAANCEAARMLTENKLAYESRVRKLVEQSLEQSFSDIDDENDDDDA